MVGSEAGGGEFRKYSQLGVPGAREVLDLTLPTGGGPLMLAASANPALTQSDFVDFTRHVGAVSTPALEDSFNVAGRKLSQGVVYYDYKTYINETGMQLRPLGAAPTGPSSAGARCAALPSTTLDADSG